jgi:hypothetical protein
MPYLPGWERLSDAATSVMTAAGIANDEARSNICQAIADRKVKIRGKLGRHTTKPIRSSTVLEGKDFEIPTDLKLEDLDWERSRPLKPWFVRRGGSVPAGYWDLDWIQLSRTELTNRLCPGGPRGEPAQPASSETGAKRRRRPDDSAWDREGRTADRSPKSAALRSVISIFLGHLLRAAPASQLAQEPHCRTCGVRRSPSQPYSF